MNAKSISIFTLSIETRYKICASLAAVLSVALVALSLVSGARRAAPQPQEEPATAVFAAAQPQAVRETPLYIIRLIGDEVRLFDADGGSEVINSIQPGTLRQVDIAALKNGLELYSEDELLFFLEDFGS